MSDSFIKKLANKAKTEDAAIALENSKVEEVFWILATRANLERRLAIYIDMASSEKSGEIKSLEVHDDSKTLKSKFSAEFLDLLNRSPGGFFNLDLISHDDSEGVWEYEGFLGFEDDEILINSGSFMKAVKIEIGKLKPSTAFHRNLCEFISSQI
jgi:hypothetical protein